MSSLHLTPLELAQFTEIFQLVDTDHGGTITKSEFTNLLHTLRVQVTPDEIEAMMSEIDNNDDGEIDFEEFITIMSKKVAAKYTSQQVKAAFMTLASLAPRGVSVSGEGRGSMHGDVNEGMISVEVLEKALQLYGYDGDTSGNAGSSQLTNAEARRHHVREMLEKLPVNEEGMFHYEQVSNRNISDQMKALTISYSRLFFVLYVVCEHLDGR